MENRARVSVEHPSVLIIKWCKHFLSNKSQQVQHFYYSCILQLLLMLIFLKDFGREQKVRGRQGGNSNRNTVGATLAAVDGEKNLRLEAEEPVMHWHNSRGRSHSWSGRSSQLCCCCRSSPSHRCCSATPGSFANCRRWYTMLCLNTC